MACVWEDLKNNPILWYHPCCCLLLLIWGGTLTLAFFFNVPLISRKCSWVKNHFLGAEEIEGGYRMDAL